METLIIASSIFIFFFSILPVVPAQRCRSDFCDPYFGPEVRFPFRLAHRQPIRCGYPGFDLQCNSQNQTILYLPRSGQFTVDHIDYTTQSVFISDPDSCLPSRALNFSLSDSPFRIPFTGLYNFFNCSSNRTQFPYSASYMPLFCLSGSNYTVVAVNSHSYPARIRAGCRRIAGVSVPMRWSVPNYWWPMGLREDLELGWNEPACGECESRGGFCGFESGSGLEIGCYVPSRSGLPKGAKYGIIIGVGIPGILCTVGLACYACGILRAIHHRHRLSLELPTTVSDLRPSIRAASGLDRPTIESYPTTVLGESKRLPKPNDSTCPICLSDYLPKETLRSIPECNHYFHSDCIDEWLKLNGTCPLCRNSPENLSSSSSSNVSPSSSSSSGLISSDDHS